jgi:cytochrome oxidase Cu insertion factor (SCO1/SenC/PrrC family)
MRADRSEFSLRSSRRSRRSIACTLLIAGMLGACASARAADGGLALSAIEESWSDDTGARLQLSEFAGQRVVLTMAYARCHRICPVTINQLKSMQQVLDQRGERAIFVVIGYDPRNETPADWRAYRRQRGLNRSNWHFLSGSAAATERFARVGGFEFWKYDEHVMHGSRALIFDSRGVQQSSLGPQQSHWADAL